ncbi:MAG: helix-turn-helix transcriptional regulator [Burkholderiaceae bacterium]|nr:helix-turn-helix transcriptional regulator [Burkholderiaceae bacterium]
MNDINAPSFDAVELLGERLLRLGRLAREVPAAEFLARAVGLLRETLSIRSAWWGLASDRDDGQTVGLYQADVSGLPDAIAADWRQIAEVDPFARNTFERRGQVQRLDVYTYRHVPALNAFADRYGFRYIMAMSLDEPTTGQLFFVVAYRDRDASAFGDDEATVFRHLLRHTLQLWHHCLQDALSRASIDGIVRAAWARPDGHLVYAGPALCELLYARWPAWDGLELPAELVQRFAGLPCTVRLPDGVLEISRQDEHVRLQRLPAGTVVPLLSPREQRVAHLFAAGLSYKEIARRLGLRPATVRTYLRNAYVRLGVSNKVQLGDALGSKGGR